MKNKDDIDFMIHCNGFVNRPLETSELTVYYWEHEDSPERSDLCFDIGFKPSFAVEIYRKAWALPDENGKFVYGCKSILPDEQRYESSTVQTTNSSTEISSPENGTTENPTNYNTNASIKITSKNPENVTTESPNNFNNKAKMVRSATLLVYSLVLGSVFWMTRSIKIL
ncbi:hypothetical protein Ddc_12127 [Ditylenchus destructor]|nr:hypothetical protein Ddc_12127 [Ditylenchus destructor]